MRSLSAPTRHGQTWRVCCAEPGCPSSRSTPTAQRGSSTFWPSTSRPNWSTQTSSNAWTCRACRCTRPGAGPRTRSSSSVATVPTTPNPWPTSSTQRSWETAKRSPLRSPRWLPRGRPRAEHLVTEYSGNLPGSRACTCPPCTRPSSMATGSYHLPRACPGYPRWSRSGRSQTWPPGRTRRTSLFPSPRWSTTGSTSRYSGDAHEAVVSVRPE